jgi:hypothetical protein
MDYYAPLNRYIMFGRGICEKYQSKDETFPEPNVLLFLEKKTIRIRGGFVIACSYHIATGGLSVEF